MRQKIYKHLMSGVSAMLPFVVAGGLLIATAFLVDIGNAETAGTNFGSSTPIANWFLKMGVIGFTLMLPIMSGFIAYSIADRPGFVPGFIGGWLASNGFADAGIIGSGFLGAILSGFIGGGLIIGLKKWTSGLPRAWAGLKPILIFPVVSTLAIAVIMLGINMAISPINTALQNWLQNLDKASPESKILVGMIAGAMAGFDYGGPVNKIAYLAGVASLTGGEPSILMAAVSAGCVTPALGTALASVVRKDKFTPALREAGKVNWVLGSCHITEGTIPFAASNPKIVMPATMLGSGVAASTSAMLLSAARVPHGALVVLPTMVNPFGWVIAITVGTIVTAAIMVFLLPVLEEQPQTA